ncbi:MAG: RDD family protein [Nanoarchaeota archaeon]|nr:RDD family protein [Nanoarchaeota archaeon]
MEKLKAHIKRTDFIEKNEVQYAGFWFRFLAYIIDYVIVYFIYFLFWTLVLFGLMFTTSLIKLLVFFKSGFFSLMAFFSVLVLDWYYRSYFESSYKQATFGKMVLGIKVTNLDGGRISFGRASMRYFLSYISAFIFCVGFIMAAFTEKKQAFHDLVSDCLVIKR